MYNARHKNYNFVQLSEVITSVNFIIDSKTAHIRAHNRIKTFEFQDILPIEVAKSILTIYRCTYIKEGYKFEPVLCSTFFQMFI